MTPKEEKTLKEIEVKLESKEGELTSTVQVGSDRGMASNEKRSKFETIASSLSKIPTPTKTEKSAQQLIAIYKEKYNSKQLKLFLFISFLVCFSIL